MLKFKFYFSFFRSTLLLLLSIIIVNNAFAFPFEVRASGSNFVWRVNDVDAGTTNSLATAINNCIGTGNREVHVLIGGTLSAQVNLQPGLTLRCHNVTFSKNHSGVGFFRDGDAGAGIKIYDMTLNNNTNFGIRLSRSSNVFIQNVRIKGGFIGIRVDSHPSRPYEVGRWVNNVTVNDCTFENCSSHGLETYGVDGFSLNTVTARNNGECGVLLNRTVNGTLGTVNAFRCCYGGGYAGLRLANDCAKITTNTLIATECGRGYFVLTGSNNSHLNNCKITNCSGLGIWLEKVVNCTVKAGCTNDPVLVTGSGSSAANVKTNGCSGARIQQQEGEFSEVTVFPNPSTDEIRVTLPSNVEEGNNNVNLYDGMGKLVLSNIFNNRQHTLFVGNLPKGVYMLKVVSKDKQFISKVIKN